MVQCWLEAGVSSSKHQIINIIVLGDLSMARLIWSICQWLGRFFDGQVDLSISVHTTQYWPAWASEAEGNHSTSVRSQEYHIYLVCTFTQDNNITTYNRHIHLKILIEILIGIVLLLCTFIKKSYNKYPP
jgi:hypothetical protein